MYIDFTYLEEIFANGVLEWFDAISVHPYTDGEPEMVLSDYIELNETISKYAVEQNIGYIAPIISGEWGWSTCTNSNGNVIKCNGGAAQGNYTLLTQAQYLVRRYLV